MGIVPAYRLVAIDLFALAVITAIFFRLLESFDRMDRPLRIYLAMTLSAAAMLALDAAGWLLEGGAGRRPVLVAIFTLFYATHAAVPLLWLLYCLELLPQSGRTLCRRLAILGCPLPVFVIIAAANPGGWLFRIDAAGFYHRGPGFAAAAVLDFAYIGLAFLIVLVAGRRIPRRARLTLLGFGLPPAAAAAFQVACDGVSVLWPATALSLLMIYLGVESELLASDFLTGLQNRRSLNRFLARRIQDHQPGKPFAALMIDVDRFKDINDGWGHPAGDQALRELAKILRGCLHHRDFIARFGGDEFVAVFDLAKPDDLAVVRARLLDQVAAANRRADRAWSLDISLGALVYEGAGFPALSPVEAAEHFLARIDAAMYAAKRAKAAETAVEPAAGAAGEAVRLPAAPD